MSEPVVVSTRGELATQIEAANDPRAVVMTMGALHAGHAELMRVARQRVGPNGHVTVTIFVNPLQFGPSEDLDKYPRTFEADKEICQREGVDLIFAPTADVMYPGGSVYVTVNPGPLGDMYEGAARPGHFSGVLTVVNKFLSLTQPDIALFGEKDYQQLTLVRLMVNDFNLPIEVVGVPTVRTPEGLALSSRNQYLDPGQLHDALSIQAAISAGQAVAQSGATAKEIEATAKSILSQNPNVQTEYVVVTNRLMGPAPKQGMARIIITAYVAGTRLLDNGPVEILPLEPGVFQ